MEITINSVNLKTSSSLKAFINEKVAPLFSQSNKIIRAQVTLRKENTRRYLNKSCEIRLEVPGNDHFVKKCTDVYEKSIMQGIDALRKILSQDKSKTIARRRHRLIL